MWEAIWAPIRAELPNIRCTAILGEARRLKGKSTGRQILSDLLRYAQNKFNYTSAQELSDDISCAVVGARGPSTVLAATPLNVGGIFGSISQFEEHLGYGGWHSDYEDGTDNQIFHFWSYVNTTAQGGSGSLGLGIFGDWFHECIDPRSDQVGQRTMEDVRTSYAGMILGLELYALQIRPDEIDDWVDRYLGSVSFYTLIQEKSMISVYNTLQTRICPLIGR